MSLERRIFWFFLLAFSLPSVGMAQGPFYAVGDGELAVEIGEFRRSTIVAERPRVELEGQKKRPVTVGDTIRMTRVAGTSYARLSYGGALSRDFAVFSPDGKRFAVVLKKGNLERNTNEYSILLFDVGESLASVVPRKLISFESSSNREAINELTWLEDNETILFLGEHPGEKTQLYAVRCSSGEVKRLTDRATSIVAYSATPSGGRIVYAAEKPAKDLVNGEVRRTGFRISSELLTDLMQGQLASYEREIYVLGNTGNPDKRLGVHDEVYGDPIALFLSLDGSRVVVKTNVRDMPQIWTEYKNEAIQKAAGLKLPKGERTWIFRYELLDTKTGASQFLLDSPISYSSQVAWSQDSRSVVLTGVYLPLDVSDAQERARRQTQAFVVEVHVPDLEVEKISGQDLELLAWDKKTMALKFRLRNSNQDKTSQADEYYRKNGPRWEQMSPGDGAITQERPEIIADQDLNTPARIVAVDPKTGQRTTLLDLNPQFKELGFGKVTEINWTGAKGRNIEGGLYLPPGYVTGYRYPLVIQTHGFDPRGFWIEGPFTTAFAAQALVSKGIVVLQVPDSHDSMGTPDEAPRMVETYEKAIDYLDGKGIINRNRVGIIGFSRTGLYVRYALTHSKYHFTAAVIADGFDDGYFNYLVFANSRPYFGSEMENLIGASPFGDGLALWLKRSSGFLLNDVMVPVQTQVNGPAALLAGWDWFSGLSRLQRPVDMIYLPDGNHILEKPWERMTSQEGVVDWFCFWLKGEVDADSTKSVQYARWLNLLRPAEQKNGR